MTERQLYRHCRLLGYSRAQTREVIFATRERIFNQAVTAHATASGSERIQ